MESVNAGPAISAGVHGACVKHQLILQCLQASNQLIHLKIYSIVKLGMGKFFSQLICNKDIFISNGIFAIAILSHLVLQLLSLASLLASGSILEVSHPVLKLVQPGLLAHLLLEPGLQEIHTLPQPLGSGLRIRPLSQSKYSSSVKVGKNLHTRW